MFHAPQKPWSTNTHRHTHLCLQHSHPVLYSQYYNYLLSRSKFSLILLHLHRPTRAHTTPPQLPSTSALSHTASLPQLFELTSLFLTQDASNEAVTQPQSCTAVPPKANIHIHALPNKNLQGWTAVTLSPEHYLPCSLRKIKSPQYTQESQSVPHIPVQHFRGMCFILWTQQLLPSSTDKEAPVSTLVSGLGLPFQNLRLEGKGHIYCTHRR